MAQGYYTLEEAARMLGMSVDDLKMVTRRGEVRSFQDRGTWRFRVQDIQEMARRRGLGSEPELPLGEARAPRPTDSPAPAPKSAPKSAGPKSGPKSASKLGGQGEVFDFSLEVEDDKGDSGRKPAGPAGGKSSKKKLPAPSTPASDSDVRLVGADDDFNLEIDSDVKMTDTPKPGKPRPSRLGGAAPRSSSKLGPPSGKLSPKPSKKSGLGGPPRPDPKKTAMGSVESQDSGVRLVPMDSDSDVRIGPAGEGQDVPLGEGKPPSGTDSDVRKHAAAERPPGGQEMLTEEINLDDELNEKEAARPQAPPQAKVRPGAKSPQPQLPTSSPFELSDPELTLPPEEAPVPTPPAEDSSSDFDLTPAGQSSSPLEGSDEFHLEVPEENATVGTAPPASGLKGPASGINLDNPVDSGISLEQGGDGSDEIEFELTLDDEPAAKSSPAVQEGSSEFELTLDAGDSPAAESSSGSDSEFELTLGMDDAAAAPAAAEEPSSEFELTLDPGDSSPEEGPGSDSEFELTLDAAGEEGAAADSDSELELEPSAESEAPAEESDSEFELSLDSSDEQELETSGAGEEGGDIFGTDLDAAGGDELEESGSEAVALNEGDTDLESSDFDIALNEEDVAAEEEESGSQVMALEEEEEDAAPAPRGRRGRRAPALDEEEPGFGELGEEEAAAEEEAAEELAPQPMVVSAPWGALPVVFLLPCVVVMFVVGVMGFELIQGMSGHHEPGLLTSAISKLIMPK